MPSTFGINSLTGTLLESVDVEHKADLKELINKDGTHSASRSVDDSFSFTVKGKGTTSVTVGASFGAAPSGVSGKIIVTNVTKTQTNDDWEGFTYSGTGYAHAT